MTQTSTDNPMASPGALRTRALSLWRELPGSPGADWLAGRGISTARAQSYGVGYDHRRTSLCFPLHDTDGVCALSYRHIGDGPYPERWIYPRGTHKGLFGAHLLSRPETGTRFVLLCEGESDTLVAADALGRLGVLGVAVGLPGASLRHQWTARLTARVVLCVPDTDRSGEHLREKALGAGIAPLRLRGRLDGGKDLSDLIAQPSGDGLFCDAIAEALLARDIFQRPAVRHESPRTHPPERTT